MAVSNARVAWIDAAKGIGISLVVFGHVIRGLVSAKVVEWGPALTLLDDWIYSFHMPLFFFLSGIFVVSQAKLFFQFAVSKLKSIAYPYFLWSIITILLKASLGSIPNRPGQLSDLLHIVYAPIEQFWFLYTLFVVLIILGAMYSLSWSPWLVALLALSVYLMPIDAGWFVIYEIKWNAVFVALGAVVGQSYLQAMERPSRVTVAIAASLGAILPAVCLLMGKSFPLAFAISGTIGAVALALLLSESAALSFMGRHSLEIFVAHTIASAAVRTALLVIGIQAVAVHVIAGTVAGLVLPLLLIRFTFLFVFGKKTRVPEGMHAAVEKA